MNLAEKAIAIALSKLGERNGSPFVADIRHWLDQGAGWMNSPAAWCACFASWCINEASYELRTPKRLPAFGATSSYYSWFQKNGLLLPSPVSLSIGMIKGDGGSPGKTHHHTFLVESVEGDFVRGIDGNWSDQVMRTRHAIAGCDFGPIV